MEHNLGRFSKTYTKLFNIEHFRTLICKSSSSNLFPKADQLIYNLCKSFLNISYILSNTCSIMSNLKHLFHVLFTSLVPFWVTSSTPHISLAQLHCDTLENSSRFKVEIIMLLVARSYWAFSFFFFSLDISRILCLHIINHMVWNERIIYNRIPYSLVNRFNKNIHSYFLKLVINMAKG